MSFKSSDSEMPMRSKQHCGHSLLCWSWYSVRLGSFEQVASAWKREKKIKAKKRVAPGQGIPLSPSMHASEGMMQALNGTMPRPASETVSRKQLTKMLAQVGTWSGVQIHLVVFPKMLLSFEQVPCVHMWCFWRHR